MMSKSMRARARMFMYMLKRRAIESVAAGKHGGRPFRRKVATCDCERLARCERDSGYLIDRGDAYDEKSRTIIIEYEKS